MVKNPSKYGTVSIADGVNCDVIDATHVLPAQKARSIATSPSLAVFQAAVVSGIEQHRNR
jgi:hypothetical protein